MTDPIQSKQQQILDNYDVMLDRVAGGHIHDSCIYGIIEAQCHIAANENGHPLSWKIYLPDRLRREQL